MCHHFYRLHFITYNALDRSLGPWYDFQCVKCHSFYKIHKSKFWRSR